MSRFTLTALLALALLFAGTTVWADSRWINIDGPLTAQEPQVVVGTNTAREFDFRVHLPGLRLRDVELNDEFWQSLELGRASQNARPGEPAVPVISRWIAIPQGAEPRITVTTGKPLVVENVTCVPAQHPAADCNGQPEPGFAFSDDIYGENAAFPGAFYQIEGPYVIRGLRMMLLRLYPVQVEPLAQRALIYADMRVRVEFTGSKGTFFGDHGSRFFQSLYRQAANRFAFANEALPAPTGKSANGAEFIILTAPHLVDAAQTLADWKILQGYDTEVYTTDESGTTTAQIKAWILEAYQTWDPAPAFILFLGDAEYIPTTYDDASVGSDLYYVTVDGNDEWADIAAARISVDTLEEAQNRVDAIVGYERYPIDDPTYYTNTYQAAYFQHAYGGYAERRFCRTSEEAYQWFNQYMENSPFTAHRIYFTESYNTPRYWNQDAYAWTPVWWTYSEVDIPPDLLRANGFAWDGNDQDITDAINEGTAFITHRDHGDNTYWVEPNYTAAQVAALNNGDRLPVVWSINCLTGYFDDEHKGEGSKGACFTEAWERNANGGAAGVLGSTRVSYSGRNDRMFWGWLDSMWPEFEPEYPDDAANEPEWRMSIVLTYGKMYMTYHYPNDPYRMIGIEEFHWFGDPTMEMWAGEPEDFSISHLPVLPMGATGFDVEIDADGALVALVQNGVILGKAISAGGAAHVDLDSPVSELDDVHLTITRRNYRPYETDLMVGAMADGIINLNRAAYAGNATVTITLSDADFENQGTYTVTIVSDTEPGGEQVTLDEIVIGSEGTATFLGQIPLTTDGVAADGELSVADGDEIEVSYYDETTGTTKSDTAYADCAPPTFAGATSVDGDDTIATVVWNAATDLTPPITYQIYRAETSGGQNYSVPTGQTTSTTFVDHGLQNFVTYYYVVRATDAFGHQDTNTVERSDMTVGPIVIWEEDFDDKAGIPETWSVVNGGAACTWSDENPGGRTSANWSGSFAIADAADCGQFAGWEDYLISEPVEVFGYTDLEVTFTHDYEAGEGLFPSHATVDVADDGTTWHNAADWRDARDGMETLDISAYADNRQQIQLRFGYSVGNFGNYWGIDNIQITGVPNNDAPVADFGATPVTGKLPLSVTFTPQTTGVVASYDWDFGDGSGSDEIAPTHVYEEPGQYTVTLSVEGPYGTDTIVKENFINAQCNVPDVDFQGDVLNGFAPLTVNFTDLTEYPEGCGPTEIGWGFGDGEQSSEANPTHVYETPGYYTVALVYSLPYGSGESREAKVAYISVACGPPNADFEADVTTGEAPLTVRFTDLSTTVEGCGDITGWEWSYGTDLDDPETTDEQNPQITFDEPGVYHVALAVTNEAGTDEEVKTAMITVTEPGDDDDDASPADDDDDDAGDSSSDDDDDDDSGCGC